MKHVFINRGGHNTKADDLQGIQLSVIQLAELLSKTIGAGPIVLNGLTTTKIGSVVTVQPGSLYYNGILYSTDIPLSLTESGGTAKIVLYDATLSSRLYKNALILPVYKRYTLKLEQSSYIPGSDEVAYNAYGSGAVTRFGNFTASPPLGTTPSTVHQKLSDLNTNITQAQSDITQLENELLDGSFDTINKSVLSIFPAVNGLSISASSAYYFRWHKPVIGALWGMAEYCIPIDYSIPGGSTLTDLNGGSNVIPSFFVRIADTPNKFGSVSLYEHRHTSHIQTVNGAPAGLSFSGDPYPNLSLASSINFISPYESLSFAKERNWGTLQGSGTFCLCGQFYFNVA